MAKGGTEAIVESAYRVMEDHAMSGGQSNEVLAMRTKVDWNLPNNVYCLNNFIDEVTEIYSNSHSLRLPVLALSDKRSKGNIVLRRLKNEVTEGSIFN